MGRFGMGQPVRRSEDLRFVTGRGRYTADICPQGTTHALILRSPHAHAQLLRVDAEAALAVPGVLAVVTAADLAADGLGDIPCLVPVHGPLGQPMPRPGRPLLARDRVRFVGEPVAMVVAETRDAAAEGIDQVQVEYHALAALASIEDVLHNGAHIQIWEGAADNLAFFWERGHEEEVERRIAASTHVVRLELVNNRVVPCPIEPRAALGLFDAASGRYTLYTSSQGAHAIQEQLSRHTLKVPPDAIRVVVPDVGGGFGTKIFHYPEEVLVLWAARRLGRPVRWAGERWEAFVGDTHGRDQRNSMVAGFDDDGRMTALRVATIANMGAYLNQYAPAIPSHMTGCMLSGVYAIPAIYASCHGVYTNTVPVDAYRGAGRPEAAYAIERLMDRAARDLKVARDEIRRRNFIRKEQMPYHTATGPTYDTGDFAGTLDRALEIADWAGFETRRAEAHARGRLRGIGLSSYIEICGFDDEEATLRCGADGGVELRIGTQSNGQGHETAYAQLVADGLGIDFDQVRVVQGDTDLIPFGNGTSGSRSLPVGGPAIGIACAQLIAEGTREAARLLQAREDDVRFADGRFTVTGTGRSLSLAELAAAMAEDAGRPLMATGRFTLRASTFPNGTHVCEVEIDPETGLAEVVTYRVVDDFGAVVNPLLLKGQIIGGVAQGIGQALFEHAIYETESAQLLTGSFVDYGLPRAAHVPPIEPEFRNIPCTTNPLGIKGAGEAGTIAACPAVVNAALDALAPLGVLHLDMPLTPETVWRAIRAAQR